MKILRVLLIFSSALSIYSCANRAAGPTGGLKDTIPPVVIRTVPESRVVNYKNKEIRIYFDENITVDKVTDNVIVSPPQETMPIVRGNAKLLTINLQDELLDSTTYSILFGDAIVDLNEKNPLKNYVFSFSTGPEIDTLQVSGRLIHAENLEPLPGILVGLHHNVHDSAIFTDQFSRIGKTDEDGFFSIQNVKQGAYKLYALGDLNRDFKYQIGEGVAFHDSVINPQVISREKADTLWNDSLNIDTIIPYRQVTYLPNDLYLKLFKEDKKRQYLVKSERPDDTYFQLIFNDFQTRLPDVIPINFDLNTQLIVQRNLSMDTLIYWIPDSAVYKQDTLTVSVHYFQSDSAFNLIPAVDTLHLTVRKYKTTKNIGDSKSEGQKRSPLLLKNNLTTTFDIFRDIQLEFQEPLNEIDLSKVGLYQKEDTVYNELKYMWIKRDSILRTFALHYTWKPEQDYELRIDSAAFASIYGKTNNALKVPFSIKSLDEYSQLKIVLEEFDSLAMIQVLDTKEVPLQEQQALSQGNVFEYLRPGDYYVRLFIDENNNELWDPGDVSLRKQPERVYYLRKKLTLRANWELEESWNHLHPDDLFKKPEDLMKKK